MKSTCRLIVGVDAVGLLRVSRLTREPDPVHFALQAELAGAWGIRARLRIDRRHLDENDMDLMNRMVKTQFYLQVSPHQDLVHLVNGLRPQNLVLSAERRDETASQMSLDAALLAKELQGIIRNIDTRSTRVFLFLDPSLEQIKVAAKIQVHGVVINVRDYTLNLRDPQREKKLTLIKDAVRFSSKFGLETHLAHGVRAEHLQDLCALPGVHAIHIGHQLVARSLLFGVHQTVDSYLKLM